jgi:membrane associated rhomboid family serine protease
MSYRNYRPTGFGGGFRFLPTAVKNLLIVNGLFFFATLVFNVSARIDLTEILGLRYWSSEKFEIYQVASHMFMHGGPFHLFTNMFALWMFGTTLENLWGAKRMIFFYIFTALGAAFLHQMVLGLEFFSLRNSIDAFIDAPTVEHLQNTIGKVEGSMEPTILGYLKSIYTDGVVSAGEQQNAIDIFNRFYQEVVTESNVVGASGAVFGILIAFALYYPNTELFLLFLPIPIKAKYFVGIYAALELYLGIQNNPGDNIAHFAHLGGALFGFILVKYWNKNNRKTFY